MKFVTKEIHAYLDYPVAILLAVAPFVLSLGTSHPAALWLSVTTGIAAFILTVLTDHHLGVWRVVPYSLHLAVDAMVGVVFIAAPFVFGFTGLDAWYYWALGGTVLIVVNAHQPDSNAATA